MGNTNTQGQLKRERMDSGGRKTSTHGFPDDDQCPVEVKIAKSSPSTHSIQFENTSDYPVVIKWTGPGKSVNISGSWDGWKRKLTLVKSHDDFTTIINLPEGKHEFKYYVDGAWICDNNLPKTQNAVGTENNVILIDKADFEVFDALDKDLQATSTTGSAAGGNASSSSDVRTPDGERSFTQDVPDRHVFESSTHPPVLPPHLLQVILNKDTPISCDPNVLPEPNHVMLNHLYALSIKDGVMVLSATHRYRKKYVTTLLYKPIK